MKIRLRVIEDRNVDDIGMSLYIDVVVQSNYRVGVSMFCIQFPVLWKGGGRRENYSWIYVLILPVP